jgi:hypothetical protein
MLFNKKINNLIYLKMSDKEDLEKKVILDFNLILEILSFFRTFPSNIPLTYLFDSEEYIEKKKLHNIYKNLCNSCKFLYEKKDSYIIFNKKYSLKYIKSERFKKKVSKIINIRKLLIYYNNDFLEDINGEKKHLKRRIHEGDKLRHTYKEVLLFMGLENIGITKIHNDGLFLSIVAYIRNEKLNNNLDIYVPGNLTRFKFVGKLKNLFDFIKTQMIIRGDLENPGNFPENIEYRAIFTYLKYCFV